MRGRQPIPLVLKPKEITTLQALLSLELPRFRGGFTA